MFCLALLGGLPASGKTSLSRYIESNLQCINIYPQEGDKGIECIKLKSPLPRIHFLTFDDLCSVEDQAKIVKTLTGWKNFRVELIEAAERYICNVCNIECRLQGPLTQRSLELVEKMKCLNANASSVESSRSRVIFLVEDNFYYKSMRYAWFQVARRDGLGFCEIYLKCPIDIAIQRNASRYQKIPERLITAMESYIEYPDAEKNKWECFSLVLDSTNKLDRSYIMPVMQLIQTAASHPAERIMNEKKVEAQIIASKNVIHQADKILRKLAGKFIKDLKAKENRSLKPPIEGIIKCRQEILSQLKQGVLTLPEDIVQSIQQSGIESKDICQELEIELQAIFIFECNKLCDYSICNGFS